MIIIRNTYLGKLSLKGMSVFLVPPEYGGGLKRVWKSFKELEGSGRILFGRIQVRV